jgi:hypothetical protein
MGAHTRRQTLHHRLSQVLKKVFGELAALNAVGDLWKSARSSSTTAYALSISKLKSSSLRSLSSFASIPRKPKDSSMFKKKPRV